MLFSSPFTTAIPRKLASSLSKTLVLAPLKIKLSQNDSFVTKPSWSPDSLCLQAKPNRRLELAALRIELVSGFKWSGVLEVVL
jgi:hypothetical protein